MTHPASCETLVQPLAGGSSNAPFTNSYGSRFRNALHGPRCGIGSRRFPRVLQLLPREVVVSPRVTLDSGKETVLECEDRVTYNYFHAGQAIELWGYAPVKKAWSGYGFGGNARWHWALDRPEGEAITGGLRAGAVGTMWLADGTKILMKDAVVFIDNDNFEIVRTTQVEGQEEITEKTIRARRVQ